MAQDNGGYACPNGSIFLTSLEKDIVQIADLQVIDSLYYENKLTNFMYEPKYLGVVVDVTEVYKLIPNNIRFPEILASLNADSVLLLLDCMRFEGTTALLANHEFCSKAWIWTDAGLRCPEETILSDSNLVHLAGVVSYSFIDEFFYGTKLRSYKEELKAIGVIVGLDSAGEAVVNRLKSFISSTGLSSLSVISLLRLFKSLKNMAHAFVDSVVKYMSGEKWVKTNHGYQKATDSILFDSEWAIISQLVDLPHLIDEAFYGVEISSFREELKILGVVVNLRDGLRFIVKGLKIRENPSRVTPDAAFVILQCVEALKKDDLWAFDKGLLSELLEKLSVAKWVRTHMGYRLPSEALLFNKDWECPLKESDGLFIDREFYKKFTFAQEKVLGEIGVNKDLKDVCSLIVKNLTSLVETNQVNRVYMFLHKFQWEPKSEDDLKHKLWIPDKSDGSRGKWMNNVDCVIHDENSLFAHCLKSLDNYYDESLLPFLRSAFNVRETPSLDDLVALWNTWCETTHKVSVEKLKVFFGLLSRNCFGEVSKKIQAAFTKLPVVGMQPLADVQLMVKEDVYISDDLLLKKAFSRSCNRPLFAWFPEEEDSSVSYFQLNEIYLNLGVKKISESVEYSVNGANLNIEKEVDLIGKPLLKLVMAVLASHQMSVPAHKRRSMCAFLRDIPVFWTDVLQQVDCRLLKCVDAKINKMVYFDSNVPRFLVHKPSWSKVQKDFQLINDFARAISDAVFSNSYHLMKMIKMGYHFLHNEREIDELLTSENLEVSAADQEFLDELFSLNPSSKTLGVKPCTHNLRNLKRRRDT